MVIRCFSVRKDMAKRGNEGVRENGVFMFIKISKNVL